MIDPDHMCDRAVGARIGKPGHGLSRGAAISLGSVALALLGLIGLNTATTIQVPTAMTRTLPSLIASWQDTEAAARHRSNITRLAHARAQGHGSPHKIGAQIVGDEGFWLSKQDLLGSTATSVGMGDRISFARGSSPGARTGTGTLDTSSNFFEVVELKELRDGVFVNTNDTAGGAVSELSVLTLVVGREVDPPAGTPPRIVRFIIEGGNISPPAARAPLAQPRNQPGAL
jgi:hypothetical protein